MPGSCRCAETTSPELAAPRTLYGCSVGPRFEPASTSFHWAQGFNAQMKIPNPRSSCSLCLLLFMTF